MTDLERKTRTLLHEIDCTRVAFWAHSATDDTSPMSEERRADAEECLSRVFDAADRLRSLMPKKIERLVWPQ